MTAVLEIRSVRWNENQSLSMIGSDVATEVNPATTLLPVNEDYETVHEIFARSSGLIKS